MAEEEPSSSAGAFHAKMSFSSGNVSEQWRMFKRQLDYYLDSKYTVKQLTSRKQIGILMTALGREGVELYDTFFDSEEKPSFDEVLMAFDAHCNPKKNTVFERSVYFRLVQKPSQTVDSFIVELKRQASLCEFSADERENLLRDILVIGIRDAKLREELLRDPELDLESAVIACKSRERSQNEASKMEALILPNPVNVAAVNKRPSTPQPQCSSCGYYHGNLRPCPAIKGTCKKCNLVGHFAKMCRTRSSTKTVKALESTPSLSPAPADVELRADLLRIYSCRASTPTEQVSDDEETAWYVDLLISGAVCSFKLDSAAECDTLSQTSYNQMSPRPHLYPSATVVKPYGAPAYRPLGKILVPYEHLELELMVMPPGEENLLGFKTCKRLHLIQRVSRVCLLNSKELFVESNRDIFQGDGKIPGLNKLYIDDAVSPKVARPRRFAYALTDRFIQTLKEMQQQDIIARVNEPTPWVSNVTLVEKTDGTLRVCLDPQSLNRAIRIPKYAIPRTDDILVKLANKKLFTVLDLKSGFWHMALDEESSKLTTFNTPIGRFRFKRMCFGINCAPEMFMAEMVKIFGDIEFVSPYFDDLIVATETEEQHDKALRSVIQRAREFNVKFNVTKLQFKQPSVQYLGLLISESGMQPAAKHIRAMAEMPTPTDKAAVLRFLGLVKFLARFVPNVSHLTSHLRQLTRKEVEFQWTASHEGEFTYLKKLIASQPVLIFFDPAKPVTIQTDASKDGLGAVLLQLDRPVAFASRALTAAEVRYSQIEKELLAIVFAAERFHEFVYGRPTLVHSDHRPLEAILVKDLDKVSARLQRLRLRLLKYNLTVKYQPGKSMLVADALSRAYLVDEVPNLEYQSVVVHATKSLAVSNEKVEWIARETLADPVLSLVAEYVQSNSWPSSPKSLAPGPANFYALKHALTSVDGLLFYENRLVVPSSLRTFFLGKLHEGHLGLEKSKRLARETVFWHGLGADVTEFHQRCTTCQKFAHNNAKQPLRPYPISAYPWQQVSIDIATYDRKDYLVAVDKYSNWPEVVLLSSKSASEVISHLQNLFARHGIPEYVISDNNPFNSSVYNEFAAEWGFTPVFTSPHFPQSNGHAERAVQTVKSLLKKCIAENSSVHYALLQYRNTPLADIGCSPAQAFVGRRLRTKLPVASTLLEPNTIPADIIVALKEKSQEIQQFYYNRAAEDLPSLTPNQPVWVKDSLADPEWQPGVVQSAGPQPRSFVVEKEGRGGTVVRNRRFLRPRTDIRKPARYVT